MRGRAFVDVGSVAPGDTATLDPAESHYLVRVRRVAAGDTVQILDGATTRHDATVVRADAKACIVQVGDPVQEPELVPRIVLMGIVDARAVADAVTLASEAGATEIVPVRTARAQASMPPATRLDKVLRAAQRQCGRAVPLRLGPVIDWPSALRPHAPLTAWVASPGAVTAPRAAGPDEGAQVLIGPEGGLTPQEVEQAHCAGFGALSLGPFVQRTPTAIVSALALLSRG